jgi:hypothetical protein
MFGHQASVETRAKQSAAHTKDFDIATAKRLRDSGWSLRRIAKIMSAGKETVRRKLAVA